MRFAAPWGSPLKSTWLEGAEKFWTRVLRKVALKGRPCCSQIALASSSEMPSVCAVASSEASSCFQAAACCSGLIPSLWSTVAIWVWVSPSAPSSSMARAVARL